MRLLSTDPAFADMCSTPSCTNYPASRHKLRVFVSLVFAKREDTLMTKERGSLNSQADLTDKLDDRMSCSD